MGSEANKINSGTSFQPTEPALCANGCGFFGTAATMNLCSKCYRDLRLEEERAAAAKAAINKAIDNPLKGSSSSHPPAAAAEAGGESGETAATTAVGSRRCLSCKKKVGLMGFKCRCGSTFCGAHRYPEKHDCTFDFKSRGKVEIAMANPVVMADRLENRI